LPLAIPAQISVVSFWLYMLRRIGFRLALAGGEVLVRVRLLIRVLIAEKQNARGAVAQRAFEMHE
jgi:hypothetical protein